ncbi:MAG: aminotransferase class I/II-fold pyridoxal phosphate-dependent enzyme [Pseudonocardia sp.]|nr:aminotransferase class I/II-fold pyridoxal phosphate-dependent enzyme [Pseudonocardia sp.]
MSEFAFDPVAFDEMSVEALRARGSYKWTRHGPDGLGAFVAEMDMGTAPPVRAALRAAVDGRDFGYLPPEPVAEMAQACADWQRERHGWVVDPADVRPMPDVVRCLELVIAHLTTPDSPVILPTPAYMPFLDLPGLLGRRILDVPAVEVNGRPAFDLDGIDAAFRAGGELLVLTNPHNPLGRVFTDGELKDLCAVVDRHGGRVFADEIHAPLIYPGHVHVPYAALSETAARQAVTATSASKAWNLPGLTCAQLILSNDADRAAIARLPAIALHGAAPLGVLSATVAYTAGGPWLDEVRRYLDGNRHALAALLAEHLPAARYVPPEGTYLAWLDLRALGLGDHPGEVLLDRTGVALTDGPLCGIPGRGHARLNFATPRPVLELMVRRIALGC